ncbi:tape measure protein [Nitrospinae bacterium]|nr:tape measure protein [Nitrospinota bacterium]
MAINQIANLGVKVDPRGAITGASRAKRAITGIGNSARNVKNRIMSLQGALLGLGAGAFIKSVITTASEVESLQVRLKFLTGSAEDAGKAFDSMNEFAKKVPFSLEEIERATPSLLTVANDVDELNELLAITGDIAAVSGLSFEDTARQLQRSFASGIASAEMFRDSGTTAFLGFEAGVSKTGAETKRIIMDMFQDGTTTAKGATAELAKTFQGQVSMMQDAFRDLKLAVAEAGVFEATAKAVIKITNAFRDPQTISMMKKFGESLTTIGTVLGNMIAGYMSLPKEVRDVGIILAVLGGKKAKVAIGALAVFSEELNRFLDLTFNADEANRKALEWANSMQDGIRAGLVRAAYEARDAENASEGLDEIVMGHGVSQYKDLIDQYKSIYQGFLFNQQRVTRDLTGTVDDYVDSIKDVGVELSPLMLLYRDEKEVLAQINDLYITGVINQKQMADSTTEVAMAYMDAVDRMRQADLDSQIKSFADSMANNIENSIMRMSQGLISFKDVVKNVFQYVAGQVFKMQVAQPLATALSGAITSSMTGMFSPNIGTGTTPPSGRAGGFANGGRPPVGVPSIVGERGAELFVPDTAGTIIPNNKLGGGQTINVTYAPQVNALDPRTAQVVIAENAPTIVGLVRQAFERNGQQVAL